MIREFLRAAVIVVAFLAVLAEMQERDDAQFFTQQED
jgi:hypothetical protein